MALKYLSELWLSIAPAMANHLWQSTVFAVIAALLALGLRKNQARVRYGLWLAASLKFLLPFSLLVALGNHLARPRHSAGTPAGFYGVMEEVSQPFAIPSAVANPPAAWARVRPASSVPIPAVLAVMWSCGFAGVLFVWLRRWRRMSAVLHSPTPLLLGREVQALRRLERMAGVRKPIPMLLSPASLEPGIFGIVRPVLVWPAGISQHLDDAQLQAILAHEVWHVRRLDNLAAAMHMMVEAIFWFYPLVWWLGARLMVERERACDEAVLQLGNAPQTYAESILKACEFSITSPLPCVSGVSGGDLKKRMVRIMTASVRPKLDARRKFLLATAAFLAVAAPIGFGLAHGQTGQANPQQGGTEPQAGNSLATTATFEVASIKPNKSGDHFVKLMFPIGEGRMSASGATVRMLLLTAYGVEESQIIGGPSWINSDRYDIEAKADESTDKALRKMSEDEQRLVRRHMLQALLADRFQLKLHHETRELPVYALVVAKNGPKIEKAKDDASLPHGVSAPPGSPGGGHFQTSVPGSGGPGPFRGVRMQFNGGEQQLTLQDQPLTFFVEILARDLGRTVVDKTGLQGRYNFKLHWVPEMGMVRMGGPGPGGPAGPGGNEPLAMGAPATPDTSGPTIFTALQEQLGLKLQSEKGPVDVLVIDQVEKPSEN